MTDITQVQAVSLLIDPNTGNLIGAKDESGGIYSLNVNVRSGIVQVELTGQNLKYDKMTENQALTNGSYITVYNNTDGGKILWAWCVVNNNNINIRVTVDGAVIINDFNLNDLYSNYFLDTNSSIFGGSAIPDLPDFITTLRQGRIVMLQFSTYGLKYDTGFKIELKANRNNLRLTRGLVVRTED